MTASDTPDAASPTGQLAAQITSLEQLVLRANLPGNLDGLLAHHILGDHRVNFAWNVNPMTPEWLQDNEDRLAHSSGLAVLGYGLAGFPSTASHTGRRHLTGGLPALMRKDPFQVDGVTFVNDPGQVVGIALAVNAAHEDVPQARTWLADILHDQRLRPPTALLGMFHQHARHIIAAAAAFRPDPRQLDDPVDLAGLHWLVTADRNVELTDPHELHGLRSRLLSGVILGQTEPSSASRAALLLAAATHIVTASVDDLILSRSHVGVLLGRFEDAMRHWRYDNDTLDHPIRWPITEEREVQNILWLILRPVFDDLVDEETLRKLGHSTYRADFGIPSLGLLVEVKYARKAADFKTFEKEIIQDYVGYLTDNEPYRKLAVFIYDESASVQEHGTTRNALLKMPDITDVIIASRPSHVPAPDRTARRRNKSR
ncbi:PD-(D/E)XK nuclease domain-containing protein [Actinokineospora alba]|uniref:PD-(D/E)XK nuclease domain-containing protein n=1 Tax=Actinokineospora alba TaxID=504798 RepID=UPI000B84375D|nr:hypothetical protein [Actinokineospora alba]